MTLLITGLIVVGGVSVALIIWQGWKALGAGIAQQEDSERVYSKN